MNRSIRGRAFTSTAVALAASAVLTACGGDNNSSSDAKPKAAPSPDAVAVKDPLVATFDGGLYVGIGGTATALVLQVLGMIEPNLLAAYSSNLFGIVCVALVKIRHVRPYKRKLIMEIQAPASAAAPVTA